MHAHTCTSLCSVLCALLSVVDEDALRKELKDFLKDSKSQVKCFPPSLSSEHRKIIHEVRIASFLPFLFLFLIWILSLVLLSRPPSLCIYLLLACPVPLHLPSLPLSSSLSVCYAVAMPLWLHAILSSHHTSYKLGTHIIRVYYTYTYPIYVVSLFDSRLQRKWDSDISAMEVETQGT